MVVVAHWEVVVAHWEDDVFSFFDHKMLGPEMKKYLFSFFGTQIFLLRGRECRKSIPLTLKYPNTYVLTSDKLRA